MNKRRMPRTKRRITCALSVEGRRATGIVIDLSPSGLFVQTTANARPGQAVRVELKLPGQKPIGLETVVARRKSAPPHMASVSRAGVGLMILNAPEAYFQLLTENEAEKDAAAG